MGRVASDPEQDAELIDWLEHLLGSLASGWRGLHIEGRTSKAQALVNIYHSVVQVLWDWGWRGAGLLPEEELPDEYMPAYFLEYWREQHDTHHRGQANAG